jgi:hypothetical protein
MGLFSEFQVMFGVPEQMIHFASSRLLSTTPSIFNKIFVTLHLLSLAAFDGHDGPVLHGLLFHSPLLDDTGTCLI